MSSLEALHYWQCDGLEDIFPRKGRKGVCDLPATQGDKLTECIAQEVV